jgi:hypothetical protein
MFMDLSKVIDSAIPNYYSHSDPMWVAMVLSVLLFALILGIVAYCIQAFFLMRLFRKANVEAWKAWVPFVNNWTFLELGGYPGWIIFIAFAGVIPIVGWMGSIVVLVFCCMAAYQIGLKLQKDGVWVVLYIFVSIVWIAICGLDRSTWDDRLGKPSLITGTPTSGGYAYGTAPGYYQQPGTYQQPYQQPGTYQPGGYQQPGSYQQPDAYPPSGYPQPGSYPQDTPYQQPGNPPSDGPYPPNDPSAQ